jgi:arylsulfatase A-like enzyme
VFPFTQVTLASALKESGYETYISGKWHLGSSPEVGPYKFGFDHSYGSLAGGVTAYEHRYKLGPYSKTWHRDGTLIEEEGHVTDLIGQDVVRNIYKAAESLNPFFIYVPFTAPHHPIEEEAKWLDLYKTKIQDPSRRTYAACVTHMDAKIGEFLDALKKTDQLHDTIVVFTSDNGAENGYRAAGRSKNSSFPAIPKDFSMPIEGRNGKLRGWKEQLYEGGIRVPAIVSCPTLVKPGKIKPPVHIVDWMPTLCSVAGYRIPSDFQLDGHNIWPCIIGEKEQVEERVLYWRTPSQMALRKGDWKLVINTVKGSDAELYNIQKDPFENYNVANMHPERVNKLYTLLEQERNRDSAVSKKSVF